VFNAGATLLADGSTLLLCRVEDRRGLSHLCAARSLNGVDGWRIDPSPTLMPDPDEYPEELWGIEDPRITFVPELQQYAVTYTSYSKGGPSFALTKDFRTFGVTGLPCRRTTRTRPLYYRIDGLWALVHRPMTPLELTSDFVLSESAALGGHRIMMKARKGAGGTLIKSACLHTDQSVSWLMLYHGAPASGSVYRIVSLSLIC
jgi:predicted GH43/DUF377 family glycosyl hydrolase